MCNDQITERQTVAEIMQRWPAMVAVFLQRRLPCPGCAFARLMTLKEAGSGSSLERFVAELSRAASGEVTS